MSEISEETVRLSRKVVNQILQHAQLNPRACGVVTSAATAYRSYPQPENHNNSSLLDPRWLQDMILKSQNSAENIAAIYLTQTTSDLSPDDFSTPEFDARKFLWLGIFLGLKGVLEIKCYQFLKNRWKKVVLELDVL
jgi:hypothetical protein